MIDIHDHNAQHSNAEKNNTLHPIVRVLGLLAAIPLVLAGIIAAPFVAVRHR